jgi:hypothetical protein
LACLVVKPARLTMCVDMARWMIPMTLLNSLGYRANSNLNGIGRLKTHWRIGYALQGLWRTSSTNSVALCVILLAPQLGQKPRRLQLNATSFSCLQSPHTTLKNPCSKRPHRKKSSNSRSTNLGKYLPCSDMASLNSG